MAKDLFFIPLGGSGGGGGFDPTQYYTKSQVDTLIQDFITRSVNDLVNYYTKSETYTQAEVNTLIGSIESIHFEFAASTSDVQDPQSNVIYLIGPSGTGADQYEEYVYANNQWKKIGDTSIDLSNYATLTDLQNAINTAMATLQQYAVENFYQKYEVDEMIAQVQTLQGIQGIKGADGVNGVDGSQGIQGIKGADGTNGQQGIQGIKGSDGINGAQGIQGIAGQNGTNGVDGQQGIQGIKGADGVNGTDGLQGIQGTMGIQGPAGGGGSTRYDIATKSQAELAEFYQNWQTIMASNDVYFGVYPVVSVNPAYTQMDIGGVTVDVMLVEYNLQLGFVDDMPNIVSGKAGAWYILPNGMGGDYTAEMLFASKTYVDNGLQGKQDQLIAGEGISIQGTTISATGGGGSNQWFGTQAQFEALQSVDTNTDYFISNPIKWGDINGRPDMSNYPTKTYVDNVDLSLDEKITSKIGGKFITQEQFQSITPKEGENYFIEGNTVALQFTFTDNTVTTYNMVID